MQPAVLNLFENIVTVQFDHRWLAKITLAAVVVLWIHAIRQDLPNRVRLGYHCLLVAACAQFALGIATLLLRVPVALGAAHQGNALILFAIVIYVNQAISVRTR